MSLPILRRILSHHINSRIYHHHHYHVPLLSCRSITTNTTSTINTQPTNNVSSLTNTTANNNNTNTINNSSPLSSTVTNELVNESESELSSTSSTASDIFNNRSIPPFNTYKLMKNLQSTGLTEKQAELLMQCLISATSDAMNTANTNLATKTDFSSLKVQLNEKIFNITLKYDLQQKHIREMFKSELDGLRSDSTFNTKNFESDFRIFQSDIKMSQKTDLYV